MNEAYLCLGGNLGNCAEIFTKTRELLVFYNIITISKSYIYKSEAWGMKNAPDFYNQVLHVKTVLEPEVLLQELLAIEKQLGRERSIEAGYESRKIDIDILFFNTEIIEKEHLHIPHPKMHERRFVLQPLNEIAPSFLHPALKKTVSQLLKECRDTGKVEKLTHVA